MPGIPIKQLLGLETIIRVIQASDIPYYVRHYLSLATELCLMDEHAWWMKHNQKIHASCFLAIQQFTHKSHDCTQSYMT